MGQQGTEQPVPNEGHPAWQEILSVLPESLHPVITPKLQEWDQGVQQKLSEVRSQYDPYKDLVNNNVSMDQIEQALTLAMTLEQNPELVVQNAIEHFNLEKFKQPQQTPTNVPGNNGEDDEFDMGDLDINQIMNHPSMKPFLDKQKELEQWVQSQQEREQNQTAEQQLADYLKTLHDNEEYGQFDDLYVTALMSNGVSAEDAIKQYHDTVNQAAQALAQAQNPNAQQNNGSGDQSQQPPVVMGNAGNVGSGLANNEVKFGELKKNELNDMVMKILENQQNT